MMRTLQRNVLARLLTAAMISALLTVAAWRAGPVALVMSLCLVVSLCLILSVVIFTALTSAPDVIALRRKHYWRWWRSTDAEGPFWPGTRIPRRPTKPRR